MCTEKFYGGSVGDEENIDKSIKNIELCISSLILDLKEAQLNLEYVQN